MALGMEINELREPVVGTATKVSFVLEPGLLDAANQVSLAHEVQLPSQLQLGDCRVSLSINFNVAHLKVGIVRCIA